MTRQAVMHMSKDLKLTAARFQTSQCIYMYQQYNHSAWATMYSGIIEVKIKTTCSWEILALLAPMVQDPTWIHNLLYSHHTAVFLQASTIYIHESVTELSKPLVHSSMSTHILLEMPHKQSSLCSLRRAYQEPMTGECSWHVLHKVAIQTDRKSVV